MSRTYVSKLQTVNFIVFQYVFLLIFGFYSSLAMGDVVIQNSDFEDDPNGTGWTFVSGNVFINPILPISGTNNTAEFSRRHISLHTISQAGISGLVHGTQYTFSIDLNVGNFNIPDISYFTFTGPGDFFREIDVYDEMTINDLFTWETFSYDFTHDENLPNPTNITLSLQNLARNGTASIDRFYADNLTITETETASAVPEPSSLALGLFAFGGLYFVRRKKKSKKA